MSRRNKSLENIIQWEQHLKDEKDLEHLKRSAVAELAELTEPFPQAPNKEMIHSVLCHIHSAKSVGRGLSIIGNDHHYLQTRSFSSNKLETEAILPNKERDQSRAAMSNSVRNNTPGAGRYGAPCFAPFASGNIH